MCNFKVVMKLQSNEKTVFGCASSQDHLKSLDFALFLSDDARSGIWTSESLEAVGRHFHCARDARICDMFSYSTSSSSFSKVLASMLDQGYEWV